MLHSFCDTQRQTDGRTDGQTDRSLYPRSPLGLFYPVFAVEPNNLDFVVHNTICRTDGLWSLSSDYSKQFRFLL